MGTLTSDYVDTALGFRLYQFTSINVSHAQILPCLCRAIPVPFSDIGSKFRLFLKKIPKTSSRSTSGRLIFQKYKNYIDLGGGGGGGFLTHSGSLPFLLTDNEVGGGTINTFYIITSRSLRGHMIIFMALVFDQYLIRESWRQLNVKTKKKLQKAKVSMSHTVRFLPSPYSGKYPAIALKALLEVPP